jgi:hypothetical protein
MQKKPRDEMVNAFEAELKKLVRGLLEALMREERAMYLETHPTSANGYYTRDFLTLVGPVGDFKVSTKARSPLPLHHDPTGAVGQGDKEADGGRESVLWGRCCRKAPILGLESAGRDMRSAQAPRICGNSNREPLCRPSTVNGAL